MAGHRDSPPVVKNEPFNSMADKKSEGSGQDAPLNAPLSPSRVMKLIAKIGSGILSLPYSHLMTAVRRAGGHDDTSILILNHRAEQAIAQIAFEAGVGNKAATIALRDLGNTIAEHLVTLAGQPDDPESVTVEDPLKYPRDRSGYYSEIVDASGVPGVSELRALMEELSKTEPGQLEVCVRSCVGATAVAAPDLVRDLVGGKHLLNFEAKSPGTPQERLVGEIVHSFVKQRVAHVARRAARETAAESVRWPISVPAVGDKRAATLEKYVSTLNLGQALGVRFHPKVGRGGIREFQTGSQARFGLDVWQILERRRQGYSIHRSKFEAAMLEIEKNPGKLVDALTGHPVWVVMAVLLPRFSGDPEVLEKWFSVAMMWAEHTCDRDWDNHNWPECVGKRMKYDPAKQRLRSGREAVAEKIREGFKRLIP